MTADRFDVSPAVPARAPWARAVTAVRNRVAAQVRRSATLRAAYARARAAAADGDPSAASATDPGSRGELQRLSQLLGDAPGRSVGAEEVRRLRRLAVAQRHQDPDGLGVAALGLLAERFDDRAARSWLAPALAEAGRFEESARLQPTFAPGRPRARGYVVTVTALAALGRTAEAEQRMRLLEERFPGLRRAFVHGWDDDQLSRCYRALVQRSPARTGALPVFQHLPFCAGSSMQSALKHVVPPGRTLQISRRWGLVQLAQAGGLSRAEVDRLMMVHQHHPFPLDLAGRPLSHFTVLRDPVSQLRSGFFKRQARDTIIGTRDAGSATFAAHAEYTLSHGLTNMSARMIVTTHPDLRARYRRRFARTGAYTMISHEEDMFWLRATRRLGESRLLQMCRETLDQNFCVVATMAHLAAGHLACSAAVGLPVAHVIEHRGRSGQPPHHGLDRLEARLREANAVDQQLYEEYTRRFEADHPELITAVEGADHVPARRPA